MNVTFYRTPCLFQEAEELLFLYANQLPMPVPLHTDSPYYVSAEERTRMMEEACRHIPQDDPILRYFFRSYPLPQERFNPHTCLARILAFSFADMNLSRADQAMSSLLESLTYLVQENYIFEDLHALTINFRPRTQSDPDPFDNGISRLTAPAQFREKLQAVLASPKEKLDALGALMEPVMEYLRQALAPWVLRAEPMAQAWEDQMRSQPLEDFFQNNLLYPLPAPASAIEAGILYFSPLMVTTGTNCDDSVIKLLVGSAVGIPWLRQDSELMGWEYRALRLLGNPLRFKMLSALRQKPMSSREMAKELNLHLGSVTRDVNSMEAVSLLHSERAGSRRRYHVNYAAIRTLAKHLLAMCPEEKPTSESQD